MGRHKFAQQARFANARLARDENEAAARGTAVNHLLISGGQLGQGVMPPQQRQCQGGQQRQGWRGNGGGLWLEGGAGLRQRADAQFTLQNEGTLFIWRSAAAQSPTAVYRAMRRRCIVSSRLSASQVLAGGGDGAGVIGSGRVAGDQGGEQGQEVGGHFMGGLQLPRLVFRRAGQGKAVHKRSPVVGDGVGQNGRLVGNAGLGKGGAVGSDEGGVESGPFLH